MKTLKVTKKEFLQAGIPLKLDNLKDDQIITGSYFNNKLGFLFPDIGVFEVLEHQAQKLEEIVKNRENNQ